MSDESPEITTTTEEVPAESAGLSVVINIPTTQPEAEGESAPATPETVVEPETTAVPAPDGLPTAADLDAVAAEQAAAEATAPAVAEPEPIVTQPLTLADVHATLVTKLESELEDAKAGLAHLKSGINAPDISHIVDLVSAQWDSVVANIESALAEFKASGGE